MSCLRLHGGSIRAYPLDVHVAPFSRCETLLPIRMDQVGKYDRAVVEVCGEGVTFSLEAPAPARQLRRFPWLAASAASLLLTLGVSFAAAASTPTIGLLGTPRRVFAGAPVEIPYAFGGWAGLEYTLRTADGRQLAAGLLDAHRGTLRFNVPSAAGNKIVLNVTVAGPFGHRSSVQNIAIAAARPRRGTLAKANAQPPRISEFALTTPAPHAGSTIAFTYATNATDGEIWLIDESGRLWAKAAITPDGATDIKLPQGTAGRELRAVLHAHNGPLDAVASVAVTVLPGALVVADPAGSGTRFGSGRTRRGDAHTFDAKRVARTGDYDCRERRTRRYERGAQ